jgi:hypothetical protein
LCFAGTPTLNSSSQNLSNPQEFDRTDIIAVGLTALKFCFNSVKKVTNDPFVDLLAMYLHFHSRTCEGIF